MSRKPIVAYLSPWSWRREQARRLDALRHRDGDNCRRCRRPIRFDLPPGHDESPRIEPMPGNAGGGEAIDTLCLCHTRCNAAGGDHTAEVKERLRLKVEAELFSKSRKRKKKAA